MGSERSYKELHDNVTAALVKTTRTAGQIANEDLSFLRTLNPKLAKALDRHNARLLSLARGLTRSASEGTSLRPPGLSRADDVDEQWRGVVDIVDSLLEKADICLDEYTGVIKKQNNSDKGAVSPGKPLTSPSKPGQSRNIPKPQLFFRNVPRNVEKTAFKPLLRSKPHAIKSLEESITPVKSTGDLPEYKHPYELEIQQHKYPTFMYTQHEPISARPFEGTTATYVDTLQGVHEMLAELKEAKEIAVDLEHHEVRSYIGIVSLMQISTRDRDWIVDTLKPWREELQVLNEVFADPEIVKVLHGAYMDAIWLQRDLGLYIVGLFDTFQAVSALGYPKRSLAALLKTFVNFDAQKQFQLADWRIRPLTKEMFEYARSDTHFLLYIFDNLRNELLQKSTDDENLMDLVMEESKKTALQRYERPIYDTELGMGPGGWYQTLIKHSAIFTKEQFAVFKAVHRWRDEIARKEDESINYVMQNNSLYSLAREMPSAIPQLLGCMSHVSDPVRKRVSELLGVIGKAKASGSSGPEMKDVLQEHPATVEYEARKASRRKEVAQVQQPTLAEIARRENLSISGDQLKAEGSIFWGSTVHGYERQKLDQAQISPNSSKYSFRIPLPNLTAEIFATNNDGHLTGVQRAVLPTDASLNGPTKPEKLSEEQEVFTVREKGGSRKRKAVNSDGGLDAYTSTEPNMQADEMKLDPMPVRDGVENTTPQKNCLSKKQKRKLRKSKDEEVNGDKSNEDSFQPDSDPEDPFDYSSAPSVLHAKPNAAEASQAQVFDPYKKAMNAPKGLGRARQETAGRSATFKQ